MCETWDGSVLRFSHCFWMVTSAHSCSYLFTTSCNLLSQVLDAKMVWVDRLGFDIRVTSTQNDVFEVRIPFPREVTDEKGAKSSFNGMSQLAWEVEKNFQVPDFKKVKQVKKIVCR